MDVDDECGATNGKRVKVLQVSRYTGNPGRRQSAPSGFRGYPRVTAVVKSPVHRAHIYQSPFGPAILPVDCGVKFGDLHFLQPDTRSDAAWRRHITSDLYFRISFDNSQCLGSRQNGTCSHDESEGGR